MTTKPSWFFELSRSLRGGTRTGAASSLLNKVIAEERDRSVMVLCWLRVILAAANAAVVVPIAEVPGLREVWPVRYGAVVYLVLAALVLLLAKLKPNPFMRWAAFTPALIDVPLVGLIEWKQATYAIQPGLILADSTIMLLGFVMLSTLALSRVLMVLVTPPALIFIWLIATAEQTPMAVKGSLLVIAAGFGPLGWVFVGKIRRLVRASRERDLLGKYILGARLGAGGMAEVFKATYSPEGGFERAVAVKRILPSFAENPEVIEMFRREAGLGARLAHPNVVQVLDFGADGETFFMAMEFIDGVPLSRVISFMKYKGIQPALPMLLYVAHELAESLAYIHSRRADDGSPMNLVHRDFNPPNVMVSRIGEVKVADFGIARSANSPSLTKAGLLRGKLSYAAPEQLQGGTLDGRTDLFALGVMLYELATMERLFTGPNELVIVDRVLHVDTPPLANERPDLPEALCTTIDELLKRDAAQRIDSGEVVIRVLADLVAKHDAVAKGRSELALMVRDSIALPIKETEPKTSRLAPNAPTGELGVTPTGR